MIRIMAITTELAIELDIPLEHVAAPHILWYWVDFSEPTEEEARLLDTHFRFHPLAIDDCLHVLQRPKLDHYEDVHFLVLHAIHPGTMQAEEVDLFLGQKFMVTFHHHPSDEIDEAWTRLSSHRKSVEKGPLYAAYMVIDKLVDAYFPTLYQLEDQLGDIESNSGQESMETMLNRLFDIRARLLRLRRTIVPMRDLLYRLLNSDRIEYMKKYLMYFNSVHDHLLKLADMLEASRDMTSDMRDNYISLNSNRMNSIMKTLTVITTIFMPLTFIAGLYGMNFAHMPELAWRWGYGAVVLIMILTGCSMYIWFRRKGWFN